MMKNEQTKTEKSKAKLYQTPALTCYGLVRDMTLGGSKAGNDSGNTTDPFSLKM